MIMFFLQQSIIDPGSASKIGSSLSNGFEANDFGDIINRLIAYAFLVAGILSVVFIFWGGLKLIFSGGKDEKIKEAVGTIRHAIIGLIVTILSFVAVAFIGGLFGLDLIGYISFEDIWSTITDLTGK